MQFGVISTVPLPSYVPGKVTIKIYKNTKRNKASETSSGIWHPQMLTAVRKWNAYFCSKAFLPLRGWSFSTCMLWNSALQQPDASIVNVDSLIMLPITAHGFCSLRLCLKSCSLMRDMPTTGREKPNPNARPPRILHQQTIKHSKSSLTPSALLLNLI